MQSGQSDRVGCDGATLLKPWSLSAIAAPWMLTGGEVRVVLGWGSGVGSLRRAGPRDDTTQPTYCFCNNRPPGDVLTHLFSLFIFVCVLQHAAVGQKGGGVSDPAERERRSSSDWGELLWPSQDCCAHSWRVIGYPTSNYCISWLFCFAIFK